MCLYRKAICVSCADYDFELVAREIAVAKSSEKRCAITPGEVKKHETAALGDRVFTAWMSFAQR